MIEFALPWVFALLPVPFLVWRFLPPAPESGAGLRIPFFGRVAALAGAAAFDRGGWGTLALTVKILAWVALVAAAAQPRWVGPPQAVATQGRDLMLALDLSGSMATEDFSVRGRAVDRFSVVRAVARQFVLDREGDRVGLVLFGTRAFLQAPITPDLQTVATLLDESEVGLAGEETALGDAVGLAVKHLRDRPAEERVLVLLSDGANNAGVLDPDVAAALAHRAGVRIYAIGVGSDGDRTRLGGPRGDLDEATLRAVAESTGGTYFRARDTEGLLHVYAEIDRLEPTDGAATTVRPVRALFAWPLAMAFAGTALLGLRRVGAEVASLLSGRGPAAGISEAGRELA